jgi:hypothetical protein
MRECALYSLGPVPVEGYNEIGSEILGSVKGSNPLNYMGDLLTFTGLCYHVVGLFEFADI